MSSEIAIQARGLSKSYPIFNKPEDRLKQMLSFGRRKYYREFWAVKDVDLEVHRGETIGIVGRNGSGKSTLLQMICGILTPTEGELTVNGRVAALLELGAGFNPEFTGRENVFMNASILGLSHEETERRFDSIAAFADICDFIDQPVKTYSSGMYARLAFAVAINVDPDILVVDEALSVGDEAFQRKCYARIEKISENGGTILFVSHAAGTVVQLCDKSVLMDLGERILTGEPKVVVSMYQKMLYAPSDRTARIRQEIKSMDCFEKPASDVPPESNVNDSYMTKESKPETPIDEEAHFDEGLQPKSTVEYPSQGVVIRDVHIENLSGKVVNVLMPGHVYSYCYIVEFHKTCHTVRFGMLLKTISGIEIAGQVSHSPGDGVSVIQNGVTLQVTFEFQNRLLGGTYFGNAGVLETEGVGDEVYMHRIIDATMFRVKYFPEQTVTAMLDLRHQSFSEVKIDYVNKSTIALGNR